jgi:hypothetical protein
MLRIETLTEKDAGECDEGLLVVAALAAVLLEYRRRKGERSADRLLPGARVSWRLISRLDQLQGPQ